MSIIVKSKVKEYAELEGRKLNVSIDFSEQLDKIVKDIVQAACKRAIANGRSTIMVKDI